MQLTEIEIKTCKENYFLDFSSKGYKHSHLHQGLMANKYYFCVPAELVSSLDIPKKYGIISFSNSFKIKIERKAEVLREDLVDIPVLYAALALASKIPDVGRVLSENKSSIDEDAAVNYRPKQLSNWKKTFVRDYNEYFK